ncbi:MAG: 30S ribosomal protein S6 [Endomicrobium sp.]|jgi:small subunit ribosomal protein S6|nr:30S ribosomal protein S6 [Endomicrobium sp.]
MNYESTFICSPELSSEKIEELTSKVTKLVETSKGTVKTVQQLGKKRLAYPISKFREGNYVYMELAGEGSMVGALENFFKLNDSVIRFLTVKVEEKKKVAAKAEQAKQEQAKSEVKPAAQESATEVKNESDSQSPLA